MNDQRPFDEHQPPLVAVIVAYNEEGNIERALKSVQGLCPIVVVDSGSTDRTEEICRKYTDHFLVNPYKNHAAQWTWAIENCPIDAKWVLALDADFEVMPELANKLRTELKQVPDDVSGIYVIHRYVFGGNEIRFGGAKKVLDAGGSPRLCCARPKRFGRFSICGEW